MLNLLYKIALSFGATGWMLGVYVLSSKTNPFELFPLWITGGSFFLISFLVSLLCLFLARYLGRDEIHSVAKISLVDQGGCFLALLLLIIASIAPDNMSFLICYVGVFLLHFQTQNQFFNPWFLLVGYHHYRVSTNLGTEIFLIIKGAVIRRPDDCAFDNLRRINNSTFVNLN